jgi:hypothetical protein
MVIGLVCSECINLTKWRVYIHSRAMLAQSHQRRFSRWFHNPRINVHKLYSALIAQALVQWGEARITLIEDTSMLWDEYCLIRLSVQYRGRAIPLVWRVIRHKSSSVSFAVYQAMLKRATRLLPVGVEVCFLADRGFADTTLMRYLRDELHWQFRIRVKSSSWIYHPGKGWKQLKQYHLVGRGRPVAGSDLDQNATPRWHAFSVSSRPSHSTGLDGRFQPVGEPANVPGIP